MTTYAEDQQIPKDKFKVLFQLTLAPPYSPLLQNVEVISAIEAVQTQLQAAAKNPPKDAIVPDLVYTLERIAGGEIKVVYWYRHAPSA